MRLFIAILVLIAAEGKTQHDDPFIADFLLKWENAREYTLEYAEAMPSTLYDYEPAEDTRPFHEQLTHVCGNMIWLSTDFLGGEGLTGKEVDNPPVDKAGVIALLEKSFDYTAETVAALDSDDLDEEVQFFAGPMTRRRILFLLTDHVTHHRGQLAIYLRLQGIVPPRYRGW